MNLRPAPPQEPLWWGWPTFAQAKETPAWPEPARPAEPARTSADQRPPTLFDEPSPVRSETAAVPSSSRQGHPLARALVSCTAYRSQRRIAGRVATTDKQVEALVSALLLAPGQRLPQAQAAVVLSVPLVSVRGAVVQVQQLLNLEGYAVLRLDVDGSTLIHDEALLREQFEVRG